MEHAGVSEACILGSNVSGFECARIRAMCDRQDAHLASRLSCSPNRPTVEDMESHVVSPVDPTDHEVKLLDLLGTGCFSACKSDYRGNAGPT